MPTGGQLMSRPGEKAAVLCLSMKGNFLFQTLNMSPSLPLPFLNSPTGFWVSHCWMVA